MMIQINTKEFSELFSRKLEELLQKAEYVGEYSWGNPSGLSGKLPTYSIKIKDEEIWCAPITWLNAGNLVENRKGLIVTDATRKQKSLGQVIEITIPYEFKRIYNTRAYVEGVHYEVRSYGKFTVGRKGLKKQDFFNYVREYDNMLICLDEENKEYIKIFEYDKELSYKEFVSQLYNYFKLIDTFKRNFR